MEASTLPVSICAVVPLFNKEEAIEATIQSVLHQTRLPDELILVDDGSSDGSLARAEQALSEVAKHVRCQLIRQENAGVSVARNRGANATKSRYIAFLDADDEWHPTYLAEVERLARAFPDAGVLTIGHMRQSEDGRRSPVPSALASDYFGIVDRFIDTYRRGYGLIHTSATTVRRDAWDRSGGFPVGARKSQDVYLWLKLGLAETVVHSAAPLSVWHDEHTGVIRRKGVVPQHFQYFLGTPEGRKALSNDDLAGFLASNLVVSIGSHRTVGDSDVVPELRRLSAVLPISARLKCWAASVIPLPVLHGMGRWRRRSRNPGQ